MTDPVAAGRKKAARQFQWRAVFCVSNRPPVPGGEACLRRLHGRYAQRQTQHGGDGEPGDRPEEGPHRDKSGRQVPFEEVERAVVAAFADVFDLDASNAAFHTPHATH